MEAKMKIFMFLIFGTLLVSGQLDGEDCTVNQKPGICKALRLCPKVREDFELGLSPTVCAHVGGITLVCCQTGGNAQPKPSQLSHARPAYSSLRISAQKCADYKKSVLTILEGGGLSVGGQTHTVGKGKCLQSVGLIVGGTKTSNGEFPHMAAIGYKELRENRFFCGGSLINDRFVLTAAHCRINTYSAPFARLGDQNIKTRSDGLIELDVPIIDFVKHEKYSSYSKENDIALAKLSQTVRFTEFIRPACLFQDSGTSENKAIATGWGAREFSANEGSDELLKVQLDLMPIRLCQTHFEDEDVVINSNQMCAGYLAGGKDTCQGDSGGPIQITAKDNRCVSEIIGITSIGIGCGFPGSKSVYTRISAYLDWIESKAFS